jgi:hypothetical protein
MSEAHRQRLRSQARWPDDRVELAGEPSEWSQAGDSGAVTTYRFCARRRDRRLCQLGVIAIPIGAFTDPAFPPNFRFTRSESMNGSPYWATIAWDSRAPAVRQLCAKTGRPVLQSTISKASFALG